MNSTLKTGLVAGMSTLALSLPVFAQVSSSSSSETAPPQDIVFSKSFSQEDIQTMIERDDAFLEHADEIFALHKNAITAHKNALTTAATIEDETERQAAVRAAHEAMHETIKAAIEANPDLKGAMLMPFGGMKVHKFRMHGPGPGMFLEKLGMTPQELKAAIESGKTLEEIAEEKGIELPARAERAGHRIFFNEKIEVEESSTH